MAQEAGVRTRGKQTGNSVTETSNKKNPTATSKLSKQFGVAPMLTLLFFSTAMLVLPQVTYFGLRHFIPNSTTIPAMGAVVMVQIIVAIYIYKAWQDESKEHEKNMKEKLKSS